MTHQIESLAEAVEAFRNPELRLLGVGLVAAEAWPDNTESLQISVEPTGMFSLEPGNASFRLRLEVNLELFQVLWIDLYANYTAPESYSATRAAFLDYANMVAAPLLRSQAQAWLNPILVAAGYPPNVLPVNLEDDIAAFRGSKLPEVLGPASMGDLRQAPELAAPDFPATELEGPAEP